MEETSRPELYQSNAMVAFKSSFILDYAWDRIIPRQIKIAGTHSVAPCVSEDARKRNAYDNEIL